MPTAFLVMELVRGEPLSLRLASRGALGAAVTLDVLEQAGRGLQAAHARGFVHRDVKPGNILIAEDGTVRLTDFGIAKAASAAPVTGSGMVMGTAHYIAPEQAKGLKATPASDVYSLAVVGYECLAGRRPFADSSPVAIAMMHINDPLPPLPADVPPNVRALIVTALTKDPQRRYADGGEFAEAVAAVRRGHPPPTPGTPPPPGTGPNPILRPSLVDRGLTGDGRALAGLPASSSRPPRRRPAAPLPTPAGRGRSVLTVSFVLLTAAAVVIGVLVVRDAVASNGQTFHRRFTPPPTTTPSADATAPTNQPLVPRDSVRLDESGYAGRPAADVQSELQNQGLRPRTRTEAGQPPPAPASCTVTGVRPAGVLPRGTAVTITCAQH
jgi:serine/threonine-protein kinase